MVEYEKVYVAMLLHIDYEGFMKPIAVEWTDGTRFEIDKIIDECNAPPEHTGGVLTRKYKIVIKGKEKIIYLDKQTNRWFVEKPLYLICTPKVRQTFGGAYFWRFSLTKPPVLLGVSKKILVNKNLVL